MDDVNSFMGQQPPEPLWLWASGLEDKFGFCDGDIVELYLDNQNCYETMGEKVFEVDRHKTLVQLVKKFLLPVIERPDVYEVNTSHNPIRSKRFRDTGEQTYTGDNDFCIDLDYKTVLENLIYVGSDTSTE